MAEEMEDVRINTVETEIVVTEGVGPLSAAEVSRLARIVADQVKREMHEAEKRQRERKIRGRSYDVPI